jgi:hypothetical protein
MFANDGYRTPSIRAADSGKDLFGFVDLISIDPGQDDPGRSRPIKVSQINSFLKDT